MNGGGFMGRGGIPAINSTYSAFGDATDPSKAATLTLTENKISDFYDTEDVLGNGLSSVVKRCVHRKTGKQYAVKIIERSANDPEVTMLIANEIEILKRIREEGGHPHVVHFQDVFVTPKHCYLVFELASGGELFDKLSEVVLFPEDQARVLMRQLLQAMAFIHHCGIVHRDVKPENILLTADGRLKIADFGLAQIVGPNDRNLREVCGTPGYLSPEAVECTVSSAAPGYRQPSDVWACGVIMYTLLVGYPPFWNSNRIVLMRSIRRGQYDLSSSYWSGISSDAKDLIRRLLCVDPAKRLTAHEALEHPWICNDPRKPLLRLFASPKLAEAMRSSSASDVFGSAQAGQVSSSLPSAFTKPFVSSDDPDAPRFMFNSFGSAPNLAALAAAQPVPPAASANASAAPAEPTRQKAVRLKGVCIGIMFSQLVWRRMQYMHGSHSDSMDDMITTTNSAGSISSLNDVSSSTSTTSLANSTSTASSEEPSAAPSTAVSVNFAAVPVVATVSVPALVDERAESLSPRAQQPQSQSQSQSGDHGEPKSDAEKNSLAGVAPHRSSSQMDVMAGKQSSVGGGGDDDAGLFMTAAHRQLAAEVDEASAGHHHQRRSSSQPSQLQQQQQQLALHHHHHAHHGHHGHHHHTHDGHRRSNTRMSLSVNTDLPGKSAFGSLLPMRTSPLQQLASLSQSVSDDPVYGDKKNRKQLDLCAFSLYTHWIHTSSATAVASASVSSSTATSAAVLPPNMQNTFESQPLSALLYNQHHHPSHHTPTQQDIDVARSVLYQFVPKIN